MSMMTSQILKFGNFTKIVPEENVKSLDNIFKVINHKQLCKQIALRIKYTPHNCLLKNVKFSIKTINN